MESRLARSAVWAAGCCVLPVLLAGCGGPADSATLEPATTITAADVAGSYKAATFVTQDSISNTDQLARGAVLDLVLTAEGSASGRLFVPDGAEDGGDFDADLTGTWSLTGNMVGFSQTADTFVRDMAFTYADGRLSGDKTFGETRVRVVLTRQL